MGRTHVAVFFCPRSCAFFTHGFSLLLDREEPMSGDLILVIVLALVFLGGMGGLLIYANTGKDEGEKGKDGEKR